MIQNTRKHSKISLLSDRVHLITHFQQLNEGRSIASFLLGDFFSPKRHDENILKLRDIQAKDVEAAVQRVDMIRKSMSEAALIPSRFDLLEKGISSVTLEGCFAEFGGYKGDTLNFIAQKTNKIVHGFDSFLGLPQDWRPGLPKGTFKVDRYRYLDFRNNVRIWKGMFEDTIPRFNDETGNQPIAFLHVDCDLYTSTKTIFEKLGHRIHKGTVIVFDEFFGYPGWSNGEYKAFKEFVDSSVSKFKYLACNHLGEQTAIVVL